MSISERIKTIRKERGLTQKALGELTSMSEGMIRQYELGIRNPKIDTIKKIASALDVSPLDLMGVDRHLKEFAQYINEEQLSKEVEVIEQVQKVFGNDFVRMMELFDELNETGRQKALNNLEDLSELPKYKK